MRAATKKYSQAEEGKLEQAKIQLKKLSEDNFERFADLLRFRDWTPEKPVSAEMPKDRAMQMAQLTADPSSGCYVWLIERQQDLKTIGVITIMPVFHFGCRQLGYWVVPEYHNQGYASLAVRAITKLCFEQMNVERMQAQVIESNPASIKVLENAGYEREALLPKSHQIDGVAADAYIYGKVKE